MAEHSWFEDHVLYLVRPKGSCLLWAAETWRFHYGRSVPATIDSFEPCIARKTAKIRAKTWKIILLHDNVRPHVAKVVKKYLKTLKWNVLPRPPYSPEIAPDYWLFRRIQYDLANHRFTSFTEIENWLQNWIAFKDESFFREFENCLRDGKK